MVSPREAPPPGLTINPGGEDPRKRPGGGGKAPDKGLSANGDSGCARARQVRTVERTARAAPAEDPKKRNGRAQPGRAARRNAISEGKPLLDVLSAGAQNQLLKYLACGSFFAGLVQPLAISARVAFPLVCLT